MNKEPINLADSSPAHPAMVGAKALAVVGPDRVAVVSPKTKRMVVANHDPVKGTVDLVVGPEEDRQLDSISVEGSQVYTGDIAYVGARRRDNQPGAIYRMAVTGCRRLSRVDEPYLSSNVPTIPGSRAVFGAASDGPWLFARVKEDLTELSRIRTRYKITKVVLDLVDPTVVYGLNADGRVLEVFAWDDAAGELTKTDEIELPHADGILDLIVRENQFLYVMANRVVHYQPDLNQIAFKYHDFFNQFESIGPVVAYEDRELDGTDSLTPKQIPGKPDNTVIYEHLNVGPDGNVSVTTEELRDLEEDRLRGKNSRQFREDGTYNPLLEEFGELYGTNMNPVEHQFQEGGPKTVIVTATNAAVAIDRNQGRLFFANALTFRLVADRPEIQVVNERQFGHPLEVQNEFGQAPQLTVERSRDEYPYVNVFRFRGIEGSTALLGKAWNNLFISREVTMMAWVKPENNEERNTATVNDYQRIIHKSKTWNSLDGFQLVLNLSRPQDAANGSNDIPPFIEAFGGRESPRVGGLQWVRSRNILTELKDGNWHLVAAVLGPDRGKIYMDAVDVTLVAAAGPIQPSDDAIAIGKIRGATTSGNGLDGHQPDYYKGLLNDVRIYNRALSSQDIVEIFEATRAAYGVEEGEGS